MAMWDQYGVVNWTPESVKSGAYVPQGSKVGYVDTATDLGNKWGWNDPRTQGALTRDVTRYQGGLTRDMLGQGFASTLSGVENLFDQYSNYGGVYGNQKSPVYSPNAPTNGYGGLFNIGSF